MNQLEAKELLNYKKLLNFFINFDIFYKPKL